MANSITAVTPAKSVNELIAKSAKFDKENANNFQRLLETSRQVKLENMGLNKAIKTYLEVGTDKQILTENQVKVLTFENVKGFISESKYKDLQLFSLHQITLVCNEVIKKYDKATALAARAEKQGAIIGKDADKLTQNTAEQKTPAPTGKVRAKVNKPDAKKVTKKVAAPVQAAA